MHNMNNNFDTLNQGYKDIHRRLKKLDRGTGSRSDHAETTSTPSGSRRYQRVPDSDESEGSEADDESGGKRTSQISKRDPKKTKTAVCPKLSRTMASPDFFCSEGSVTTPLYFCY